MDENEIAQALAEMSEFDRMEREEARAVERAERGAIFERVEEIIAEHADWGRDVEAAQVALGEFWTLGELKSVGAYLAARPYNESTFDIEWAILAATKRAA